MMTTVEGVRRRNLSYGTFADITAAALLRWTPASVTFDGDLSEEETHLIWARMESTDDIDQAKRAGLRADRDALEPEDRLRRLYNYMLGEA